MEVKIKYLGLLVDHTGLESELIKISGENTVFGLQEIIKKKYRQLSGVHFRVAVNLKLADDSVIISEGDEIALLPAFAGG